MAAVGPPLLRRELGDAGEMSGRRFHVRGEQVKVTASHFFLILRTVALARRSLLSAAGSLSLSSRREASDARSLLSDRRSRESDRGALKSETGGGAGVLGRSTTAVTVPMTRKRRGTDRARRERDSRAARQRVHHRPNSRSRYPHLRCEPRRRRRAAARRVRYRRASANHRR